MILVADSCSGQICASVAVYCLLIWYQLFRFKKGLWRKTTPKGLKLKKFIEGPGGTHIHDTSYVGEDAWDDGMSEENVKKIINHNERLNAEDKMVLKEDQGISG